MDAATALVLAAAVLVLAATIWLLAWRSNRS
jgi:hypothetical protein